MHNAHFIKGEKMTVFSAIRSVCAMRINDVSKIPYPYPPEKGKRIKYRWICAKKKCNCLCNEANCPVIKKVYFRCGIL